MRDLDDISSYPTDLYLTEIKPHGAHPFEGGSKRILPLALGSNAFAQSGDGALIGEDMRRPGEGAAAEVQAKCTRLYQLRFNYFVPVHNLQLKYVLWR